MTWKCEEVQDRTLRAAEDEQAFRLHLAALDWSLVDPIVINGAEDIKSVNWRERGLKPFTHQVQNLITFCRRLPVALIADDVGLGKTISAGLILSELISRRRVNRALIICPKVLAPQWVAELDEKFGLVGKDVTGKELDAELQRSTPVVVTTYDSARARLEKIEPGMFDICILDEAHKLRNLYGSQKPPALALRVKEALERRPFRFVLMLTATPIQNKVWDLYSLIDLLKVAEGKPNPLGTPNEFSTQYLAPGTSGRQLKPNQSEKFRRLVRESLSRTRRTDVKLRFPDRRVEMVRVPLQNAELDLIKIVGGIIEELNGLQQVSIAQAMMSSPRALVAQCENMVRNASLEEDSFRAIKSASARVDAPAKLVHLLKLLDQLRNENPTTWRAVVFTVRRETQEMIGETLQSRGVPYGFIKGGDAEGNQRAISGYRQDTPKIHVIVSTDAGAEGVNLQAGNVLINYDLPWNPMIVEQRIGRVQRLGSVFDRVVILNLVGAGTVEDRIVARLTQKLQGVSQAIGDIEGILEAADIDDDGEESFEARVRKMVVDALRGQDVSKAREMIEQNIEDARQLFESQRTELDTTLGGGGDIKEIGKPLPKIDRKPPRIGFRDFVLEAKKREGFQIRAVDGDNFEAIGPGRVPERICFSEVQPDGAGKAVFASQSTRSYLPGKPAFERLVQHWVDHQAHVVVDMAADAREIGIELGKRWCETKTGCELVEAEYRFEKKLFQGLAIMKVRAGNGVDSFEKILRGRIAAASGHDQVKPDSTLPKISNDVQISEIIPNFQRSIQMAVERDKEVGQFCDFYVERLRESMLAAGNDKSRQAKVEGDFKPFVQTEVLGLEGARYETGIVKITYRVDGVVYASELTVIGSTRQVLKSPVIAACAITGIECPEDCLDECAGTKQKVLRHRLQKTTDGKLARPDQIVTCEVSGDQILIAESGRSAVSGKTVAAQLLKRCELTGDVALPEEMGVSALSRMTVRRDRLIKSDLSGRLGVPNEIVVCKATNRSVLIDEAIRSTTTKEWYAKDQLLTSALTGRLATPPDTVICDVTGDRVLHDEVDTCTVSWKKVRKDLLVKSMESGRLFRHEFGDKTDDGKWALPTEIQSCAWRQRKMLISEMGGCKLTGLKFDKRYLNENDEFMPLRKLLNDSQSGLPFEAEQQKLLSQQPGWEKSPVWSVKHTKGPSGKVAVIVAEEKLLFGLRIRTRGVLVNTDPEFKVICETLLGQRKEGSWVNV